MNYTPEDTASLTFEIAYERFTKTVRNSLLKGKGTLEVMADRSRFTFKGKRNGLFGGKHEISLERDAIANVHQRGDCIAFDAVVDPSSAYSKSFVFYCADDATAAEVAALLPHTFTRGEEEELEKLAAFEAVCPEIPPTSSPTLIIASINAVVFVLMATLGGAGWFEPEMAPYIKYGANNGALTSQGEWWRLGTSMFLHYGIIHVLLNIWVMKDVGQLLERIVGRVSFLLVYFGTGILAGLASILWYKDAVWSAGASGAVFGIYGTLLALSLKDKEHLPPSLFAPIRNSSIAFIGYNLLYGFTVEGIDNAAHIGGLVSGFALGVVLSCPLNTPDRSEAMSRNFKKAIALLVAATGIAVFSVPEFDYNARENIELSENWIEFEIQETALINNNLDLINAADRTASERARAIALMEDQIIPMYERWAQVFSEAAYQEASPPESNRQRLANYSLARRAAFEALLSSIKQPNDADNERFSERLTEADRIYQTLQP